MHFTLEKLLKNNQNKYISRYLDILIIIRYNFLNGENMEVFLKSVAALNDETRVLLLRFIDENGECCVCDLQESLDMIQSRLSRHLKILKDAGFLRVDRKGTWAYYSVRSPLDRFRSEALQEIKHLDIKLPTLKKPSQTGECKV